jgi:RHS repeat-associated protein
MDSAAAYIYGTAETPAEQVSLTSGTISYLISDLLGSVRGVVSGTGALTATTAYDAWGNPETSGGLSASTPFGYPGAYADPTGLLYLVNRYYGPATGQFTSVDPDVTQTQQSYGYASGDPVALTDPAGLCTYLKGGVKCRTDKLLWGNKTSLSTFQHCRDQVCKPQSGCNNHGDSHGVFLDWSSDGCS